MRRQRDDGLRVREREPDPGGGQRVDVRRARRPAVAAERVAAQRVDRDQQDVAVRRPAAKIARRFFADSADTAETTTRSRAGSREPRQYASKNLNRTVSDSK